MHQGMAAVSRARAQTLFVQIAEWREEGKAEIVPGVLFIDEASSHISLSISPHADASCQNHG